MTKQKSDEMVKDYYERFRKVIARGGAKLSDPFVSLHFKLNLKDSICSNMLSVSDKSLYELVKVACNVETGQKAVSKL